MQEMKTILWIAVALGLFTLCFTPYSSLGTAITLCPSIILNFLLSRECEKTEEKSRKLLTEQAKIEARELIFLEETIAATSSNWFLYKEGKVNEILLKVNSVHPELLPWFTESIAKSIAAEINSIESKYHDGGFTTIDRLLQYTGIKEAGDDIGTSLLLSQLQGKVIVNSKAKIIKALESECDFYLKEDHHEVFKLLEKLGQVEIYRSMDLKSYLRNRLKVSLDTV